MIEDIKKLRVQIDGLAELTKELKGIPMHDNRSNNPEFWVNSDETLKSYDSLILAKAWLGKVLGELGEKSPYKAGYKTKEDIKPIADTKNTADPMGLIHNNHLGFKVSWDNKNHIEKVDWLRTEIQRLIDTSPDFSNDFSEFTLENIVAEQTLAYKYLTEAKFWLGFELSRLRDTK